MAVFILTYIDDSEQPRIIKNLGVFTKRSLSLQYLKEFVKTNEKIKRGRFKFDLDDLINREHEIDFNPSKLLLYETAFNKVILEVSFLK